MVAQPLPLDPDLAEQKPKRHKRTKEELLAAGYYDDKPDKAPAKVSLDKPVSRRKEIGAFVETINGVVLAFPWTRDDALTQDEAESLTSGFDQWQMSDKNVRKWLDRSGKYTGLAAFAVAAAGIVITRLMRHGVIPMPKLSEEQQAELRAYYEEQQRRNGSVPPVYAEAVG